MWHTLQQPGTTLAEARQARFQPNVFLQGLIFVAVMLIADLLMSFVTDIPFVILLSSKAADSTAAERFLMLLELQNTNWALLLMLFATVLEIAVPIFYCRKIEKRTLRSMGFSKENRLKQYSTGFAIGAAMLLASAGLAAMCGSIQITLSEMISPWLVLLFLLGYMVQGMAEEVLVRGYFMISLANKVPMAWAVAISSLAFAAMHLLNNGITVLAFLNLTLFGVFMAFYLLRTDNIWGAGALHSAWNFFQGNIIGVQVSGTKLTPTVFYSHFTSKDALINGGLFGLEGGLAVTLMLAVAIAVVLFLPLKNKTLPNPEMQPE